MTDTPSQAPGWYYAQGDPPGTQRYWDGTQWQGGPQAVPATGAAAGIAGAGPGGRKAAGTGSRFVAFLIDVGIGIGIYIVGIVLVVILGGISDALGTLMSFLLGISYLAYAIYNWLYLQGTTGQTIGKKQQGTMLLNSETGEPVGIGMAFVRGLLIAIFAIPCYLDHWWILVDDDNRRLSDKVLKFHVYDR